MTPPESHFLGDLYARHNRNRGRGFLFGGDERVSVIRSLLPPEPRHVLDLGCRDGSLANALALDATDVVGVDIDYDALSVAAHKNRLTSCCANLWESLPFRNGAFEVVLAGELLEHLPFPERMIGEAARVLSPGGVFIGSVPNAYRLKNRLLFLSGRQFEKDPTHLRHFSVGSLRGLLNEYFVDVRIHPAVGRFVALSRRLMANDLVWRASSVALTESATNSR